MVVTGASGFVGRALVSRLLAEDFDVTAIVRREELLPALRELGATAVIASLGDPHAIAEASKGADVVFHCAMERRSSTPANALAWINVAGTENVVRAARHASVRRVVLASCADVTLTDADRVHWNEDKQHAGPPLGASARSRLLAEEVALSLSQPTCDVTSVRPAWLWGPGDTAELPSLLREARVGGIRLVGAGENLFATTYIDHAIDALLSASEARGVGGRAYFVADSEFLEAREYFGALSTSLGLPPPRTGLPYPLEFARARWRELRGALDGPHPADVARRGRSTVFDVQRAATELDYRPTVPLHDGLAALSAWVSQIGGIDAVLARERASTTPRDIEEQQRLADTAPA